MLKIKVSALALAALCGGVVPVMADGIAVNGIAVNGIAVNGIAVNGIAVNGVAADGLVQNVGDAAVVSVLLPEDR